MLAQQTLLAAGLLLALGGCDSQASAPPSAPADRIAQADESATVGLTQGANYTIAHLPVALTPEEPGELVLRVTPGSGFKVNVEYPWSLTLEAPPGVVLAQTVWSPAGAERLSEDEALFRVPVTATGSAEAEVAGDLRFSICNATRCDVLRAQVTWAIATAE